MTAPTITYSNHGMQERPYGDTFVRFEMAFVEPVDYDHALAAAHIERTFNDRATGTYEDLVKAGIIVPTKVERVALQNAASIASLLLTTECAIVDVKEKKKAGGGGHSHGEDMDY